MDETLTQQSATLSVAAELFEYTASSDPPTSPGRPGPHSHDDRQTSAAHRTDPQIYDSTRRRHASRYPLAAVTLLAAFVIGPDRLGVSDGPSVAPAFREEMPRPRLVAETTATKSAGRRPISRDARREEKPKESSTATLKFKDARLCVGTACQVVLGRGAHDAPLRILEPVSPGAAGPEGVACVSDLKTADVAITSRSLTASSGAPAEPAAVAARDGSAAASTQHVAETALPISFADIGEVEIVLLQRNGAEPARATVALRQRGGREFARFDLKVDPGLLAETARASTKGEDEEHDNTPHDQLDDRASAPTGSVPAAKLTKTKPKRERAKPRAPRAKSQSVRAAGVVADTQARQASPVRPPRGLFPLEFASPSTAMPEPVQAASGKSPEISSNDLASQPTPQTVARPPGLETLMGLGGGSHIDEP